MGKTARLAVSIAVAAAVFAVTLNPSYAFAAFTITNAVTTAAFGPGHPRPEAAESAVKTPTPARVRGYGESRLFLAYTLFETSKAPIAGVAVDMGAIHDGRVDTVLKRYLGDDVVTLTGNTVNTGTDKRYQGGVVKWYESTGANPGPGFPAIVTLLPTIVTANHRGDGVMMVATTWEPVKSDKFQETYPAGGPVPASVAAKWQKVFDWRDGTQAVNNPASWKWSANALLHTAHYILFVEKAPRAAGQDPTGAQLLATWNVFFAPTLAYWTAAANICDEAVALKAGGTEPRYRSALSHKLTDPHKQVKEGLTACFDGWISPRADGALVVYAGKYAAPTVDIGPEHIVSYRWQDGVDDESSVNIITLTYISAAHEYAAVETTPWEDAAAIAARGAERAQPLENPVPSHGQARRLAKRQMSRVNAPYRGTVTTNVAGRIARGQRYINLLIEEAGAVFFDGVAEIIALTRNLTTGGVTFDWIAADPNVDAWNPATEEGDAAANGARLVPDPLAMPVITSVTVVDGPRLQIDGTGPDRDDLVWFARVRPDGAALWGPDLIFSDAAAGAAVSITTEIVAHGDLEVAIAYQVADGRVSDFSAVSNVTVDEEVIFNGGGAAGW